MPQAQSPQHARKDVKQSRGELRLTSPAIADGATIPKRYTADGDGESPPLTWNDGPLGTESYALIVDDPDAPSGTFTHWLVWNIKADQHKLDEGVSETAERFDVRQGENDFGTTGYGPPSPPRGKAHRYVFRLFALDTKLDVKAGARRDEIERAMDGHVLAQSTLIGKYGR